MLLRNTVWSIGAAGASSSPSCFKRGMEGHSNTTLNCCTQHLDAAASWSIKTHAGWLERALHLCALLP
jgi:hypothetical protein